MERRWWTLIAVCGATFMLLVDITIVQVALPTIRRSLNANFSDLQWIISAYSLTLASLLLTQGSLADRFGRKKIFLVGVAIFTASSLSCALANSALFLILARAAQGVGGAAMFATSLALIAQEFHGAERAQAIAAWGATVGGAVAIGPLVGGALTSGLGWRWIFYVNVPIGVAVLALALTRMENVTDPGATRLDWPGLVTFAGSLFLLVLGLIRGNIDGWTSSKVLAYLVSAGVLMVVFVVVELRQQRPMFDLSLFRKPAFTGVSIGTFAIGAGMFALLTYLVLYLQNYLGLSPLQAGERLLPMTVMAFFVPLAARQVANRVPPAVPLTIGLGLSALGIFLLHGLTVTSTWTAMLTGLIVGGVGIGLANPAIAQTALGVVSPERSGMASGISNTFRVGGVATGVAALGAVFQQRIAASLGASLGHPAPKLAQAVAAAGPQVLAPLRAVRPGIVLAASNAFVGALDDVIAVGAATVFVGALFALLVRRRDFVQLSHAAAPPVEAPPREAREVPA